MITSHFPHGIWEVGSETEMRISIFKSLSSGFDELWIFFCVAAYFGILPAHQKVANNKPREFMVERRNVNNRETRRPTIYCDGILATLCCRCIVHVRDGPTGFYKELNCSICCFIDVIVNLEIYTTPYWWRTRNLTYLCKAVPTWLLPLNHLTKFSDRFYT